MNNTKLGQTAILTLAMVGALAGQALANVGQIKEYKGAFSDTKPQCGSCHAVEKPTKDAHDLNAYGLKAKELSGADAAPTAEIYQGLGRAEDFKAEQAAEVQE